MAGPTLKVMFMADTANLKKGVDEAGGATDGFKDKLGKVAGAIGAAFVAKKVVDFAKDSIKAAQDLNANMSRTNTIFGAAASSVEKWSESSAKNLRISQAEALGAANAIGKTLVGSFGMSGKAAAEMSTGVVELARDMAAFNRIPFSEALDKVTAGINGQTRGLKQLGVNLSASEIELKAVQMGLGQTTVDMGKMEKANIALQKANLTYADSVAKWGADSVQAQKALLGVEGAQVSLDQVMAGGKTTVDAAGKAQATYALMMEKTKLQQGATEKGAGSLKGMQERLSAEWKDAQATLGQQLLPVITELFKIFSDVGVPIIQLAATVFEALGPAVMPLVVALGVLAAGIKIATVAQNLFNISLLANPITWIVIGVAALIAIIVVLATRTQFFQKIWEGMTKGVVAAWNTVKDGVLWLFNWVKSNWPLLVAILGGPIGVAVALIVSHWDRIKGVVDKVFGWFKELPGKVLDALVSGFNAVISWFSGLGQRIVGAFTGIDLFDAGRRILESLGRGIAAAGEQVIEKAKGIAEKVKGLWPFSPAKWGPFAQAPPERSGRKLVELWAEGMESARRSLETTAARVAGSAALEPATIIGAGPTSAAPAPGGAYGGPAVVIQHATFEDEADIDVFLRRVSWAAATGSI